MVASSIILTVFSVLAEYCYIYPIYYLIAAGLGRSLVFSPGQGAALLIGVTLLNTWFTTGRSYRLVTVWLINLGLGAIVFLYFGGPYIFLTAHGFKAIFAFWLFFITIVWLWFRAAWLVHRTINFSKAVSRFELSMTLMFITFWISAYTIPIPGAIFWLLAGLLTNSAALAQTQSGFEGLQGAANWWGPGLAAIVLIPLAFILMKILPRLYTPAQYLYNSAQPFLSSLGQIFLVPLLWFVQLAHLAPSKSLVKENTPAIVPEQFDFGSAAIPGTSPLIKILLWALFICFLLTLVLAVVYLVYSLLTKLWRRQSPGAKERTYTLKARNWWQTILAKVLIFFESIGLVLLACLPGGLKVNQAYRALQNWGSHHNFPRKGYETPFEYYQRLVENFPRQQPNLKIIIEQFVRYQYGGKVIDPGLSKEIKASVRHLFFLWFV